MRNRSQHLVMVALLVAAVSAAGCGGDRSSASIPVKVEVRETWHEQGGSARSRAEKRQDDPKGGDEAVGQASSLPAEGNVRPTAAAGDTAAPPTLAVLDFVDRGPSLELAVLRDALAEMLMGDLSGYEGLQLVERHRVQGFLSERDLADAGLTRAETAAEAGRELAADYLLSGSFSGSGEDVTVEATLTRMGSKKSPLTGKVDSQELATWELTTSVSGLFDLERELTRRVLRELNLEGAARRAPPEPQAGPTPTVAVLAFRNVGPSSRLAVMQSGFADLLQTNLSALEEVRLVERERLHEVLKEQKLSIAGAVDLETAVRVGKLLGAERLVYGSFLELGEQLRLEVRLADTGTASVVRTESAQGPTEEFAALLEELALRLARDLALEPPSDAVKRVKGKTTTRNLEAAIHYSNGNAASFQGRHAEAARHYERSLLLDSENFHDTTQLLRAWGELEEYQKVIDLGLRALERELPPEHRICCRAGIQSSVAYAYHRTGQYAANVEFCKGAIAEELDPEVVDDLQFYLGFSLESLGRTDEAAAMYEKVLEVAQATSDVERYDQMLRELLHHYIAYAKMQGADVEKSKEYAQRAVETFDRILEAAKDRPTKEWEDWALRYMNRIRAVVYREPQSGERYYLTPAQEEDCLRRGMEAFRNVPRVVWQTQRELLDLCALEDKHKEAIELARYLVEHQDDADTGGATDRWDFGLRWDERKSWLDTVIEAQYTLARSQEQLGETEQAIAAYEALVRDYGIAHHRGPSVSDALNRLGRELVFPKKSALVVGGGANGNRSWREFLKPFGYRVHSVLQDRFTAAHLAPYSLVVLVRPGSVHMQPSEALALRAHVATGGALLAVVSPGWSRAAPSLNNPVLSFFGVHAGTDIESRSRSTRLADHPITRGIRKVLAKHAVPLEVPEGASLVESQGRTVLAALPYRRGRVVVASIGQWFLPGADWLLTDDEPGYVPESTAIGWTSLRYAPLDRGKALQLPLLRNVVSWLCERFGDQEITPAREEFAAAQVVALKEQYHFVPRETTRKAMDRLIASAGPDLWKEEALWAAAMASQQLYWFRYGKTRNRVAYSWSLRESPPEPDSQYYERLIELFPESPLRPYAEWGRAECKFAKLDRSPLKPSVMPANWSRYGIEPEKVEEVARLYEKVNASEGSYAWAWVQLRLGELRLRNGEVEEALGHFRLVADRMGSGVEKTLATVSVATCEERLGMIDEAVRHYRIVLDMPDVVWRWSQYDPSGWAPLRHDGTLCRSGSHQFTSLHLEELGK